MYALKKISIRLVKRLIGGGDDELERDDSTGIHQ